MANKQGKRRWRIAGCIGFTILVVGTISTVFMIMVINALSGWIVVDVDGPGCLGERPFDLERVEQRGNFELPKSVTNFEIYSIVGGRSCTIYASFDIRPEYLSELLASTEISGPLRSTEKHVTIPSGFNDLSVTFPPINWKITPSDNFIFGENLTNVYETQIIAVDIHNFKHYSVYIITTLH